MLIFFFFSVPTSIPTAVSSSTPTFQLATVAPTLTTSPSADPTYKPTATPTTPAPPVNPLNNIIIIVSAVIVALGLIYLYRVKCSSKPAGSAGNDVEFTPVSDSAQNSIRNNHRDKDDSKKHGKYDHDDIDGLN